MKIILKQDSKNLGSIGEIIEVKPGYARNYLFPRNVAMPVSKGNLRILEEEKKRLDLRINKEKKQAEKLAAEISKISLTAPVNVGEEDKIFGSVTSQNIIDLLKEKGIEIDKRRVILEEPIKALGIYPIKIKLHSDVEAEVKLWVVKE